MNIDNFDILFKNKVDQIENSPISKKWNKEYAWNRLEVRLNEYTFSKFAILIKKISIILVIISVIVIPIWLITKDSDDVNNDSSPIIENTELNENLPQTDSISTLNNNPVKDTAKIKIDSSAAAIKNNQPKKDSIALTTKPKPIFKTIKPPTTNNNNKYKTTNPETKPIPTTTVEPTTVPAPASTEPVKTDVNPPAENNNPTPPTENQPINNPMGPLE